MPTTSAAPLGDPQWIFAGTPPGPKANGEVFTRTRTAALGRARRSCWHEWSACDPGGVVDLDSVDVWRRSNPSLESPRASSLQLEVVQGERGQYSDEGFARERLGVWDDPELHGSVIPADAWALCRDPDAAVAGRPAFAFDVSPDRSTAAIGVGGPGSDLVPVIEVAEHGPGTGWIIPWLLERQRRYSARVVCDATGPAGGLLADAERQGLKVDVVSARDHAQACGGFFDAVMDGQLRHRGDQLLDDALAGASQRQMGEAWLWSRKNSTVDITPLVAVTLAHQAAVGSGPSVYEERGLMVLG